MKNLYKSIFFAFIFIIGYQYNILALDGGISFNPNPGVKLLTDFPSSDTDSKITGDYIRPNAFKTHALSNTSEEIFISSDSNIYLLELQESSSKIKWSIDIDNIYISNINVIDNHLIVSGELYDSISPETVVKIFDITDSSNIFLQETYVFSGSYIDMSIAGNSIVLFTHFDSSKGYQLPLPYYTKDSFKYYINKNSTLKKTDANDNSVVVYSKIHLSSSPKVSEFKTFIGFGHNLYINDNMMYITSNDETSTFIYSFNFSKDIFKSVKSIQLSGVINNYDSLNILNDNLRIVTSIEKKDYFSYGIFYLDKNLNLIQSHLPEVPSFVESLHFTDDMLFIKYQGEDYSTSDTWKSIRFFNNRFQFDDIKNFDYSNTVITTNYAFILDSDSNDEISMNIFDKDFNTVGSQSLSTNNSVFLSTHLMAYSELQPMAAVPIYLKPDVIYPGVLVFKKDESNNISINLMVSPNASESMSYMNHKPDWMKIIDSYLYVFFKDKIMIYDLDNNSFIKSLNLI